MKNILILVDIQKEYNTSGRDYYLRGITNSLNQCSRLLEYARNNKWEIAHVQHSNQNKKTVDRFMPGTIYFDFIEGFEPVDGENHYIKNDFSCYSSQEFSKFMSNLNHSSANLKIYVAGYNSVMCCLSTLEESRRQNHKINFVTDASLAKSISNMSEIQTHEMMLKIYQEKNLATLVTTQDTIASSKK